MLFNIIYQQSYDFPHFLILWLTFDLCHSFFKFFWANTFVIVCVVCLCLFQAADGQHLILHPLNMKCLLHHYGSYDILPHRFGGKKLNYVLYCVIRSVWKLLWWVFWYPSHSNGKKKCLSRMKNFLKHCNLNCICKIRFLYLMLILNRHHS